MSGPHLREGVEVLDEVLVRLVAVPLALARGPPCLPVLNSVLRPVVHREHILLPLVLPRLRRRQLGICLKYLLLFCIYLCGELDVAEAAEELLDGVVGDGVRPAQVREGLVLDGHQQVTELLRQQRPGSCLKYLFYLIYLVSRPDGPDVLLPVPGVDGDEGLHVPDGVELSGDDVRRQGEEVALVQTYPPVVGLQAG